MRTPARHPHANRQAGFTIIELMVGMLLALLTTVIIAEVMSRAEGNRRTTTEGSDAQVNAALSLYALQRDIQMSGYGLINNPTVLGCTVKAQFSGNTAHTLTLAPVIINAGADAATSDTITVMRSGTTGYAIPIITTSNHASTDTAFYVQSTLGLQQGDLLMALPATPSASAWCTLFAVNADSSTTLTTTRIPHLSTTTGWNPSTSIMPSSYLSGTTLAKVTNLVQRSFAVSNGALQSTDWQTTDDSSATTTVGNNIVLMKAFYGKDTNNDGTVDTYDTTTPTTNAGWQQVRTIRIAVVARSIQREKTQVTKVDPTLDVGSTVTVSGSSPCNSSSKCITLQVSPTSGTSTEWQYYRYKVFDTVVPLRNMLWSS